MGSSVLHYEILEKLGQGGMGVVYKAHDTKLDRPVALKFLPEPLASDAETKRRLLAEARAASVLDHPNVCPIHSVEEAPDGRAFICMAWCEGESLKQRLDRGAPSLDEALDIAIQVGRGLEAAHDRGIIHRDIKPSNVMVSSKGQVRITDFGLARIERSTRSTRGAAAGTVQYMSPEQVKGGKIDRRTDVWSLGVVLYELLTGCLPFDGEYEAAVLYAIVNEAAAPVTPSNEAIPAELERVLGKALEKDVSLRYASIGEMVEDLERVRRSSPSDAAAAAMRRVEKGRLARLRRVVLVSCAVPAAAALGLASYELHLSSLKPVTVAVLELQGESRDSTYAGLLEGLLESDLAQNPRIATLSKERCSELKARLKIGAVDEDAAFAVSRSAPVALLVSPSAVEAGNALQITARAYDVPTGKKLFVEQVQGGKSDGGLFTLIDQLSGKVQRRIGGGHRWARPDHESRIADLMTTSLEAYRLFSKGDSMYSDGDPIHGIRLIEMAVAADSNFVEAYRRLALWYDYLGDNRLALYYARKLREHSGGDELAALKSEIIDERVRGRFDEAISLMERYLKIRPGDVAMQRDLGYVLYRDKKDYRKAISHLQEALDLDRNNLKGLGQKTRSCLGNAYLYAGQFDQALNEFEACRRMVSNTIDVDHCVATVMRERGDYTEAVEAYKKIIRADPTFYWAYQDLGATYLALGKWRKAVIQFGSLADMASGAKRQEAHALIGYVQLKQGAFDLAEQRCDSLFAIDPNSLRGHWLRGRIALARGKGLDRANRELRACEELVSLGVPPHELPFYDSLKGWMLIARGKLDVGVAELKLADTRALPGAPLFHEDVIEGCIAAGRLRDAIDMGLDLHARNERDPEASYLLGRAYEREGEVAQARRFYELARSVWGEADPDFGPLRTLASRRI
jgi:serine/threonine protein kinase/tetratricopeptide (TPR) repeat protein